MIPLKTQKVHSPKKKYERKLLLLLLNCSARPRLGPAFTRFAYFFWGSLNYLWEIYVIILVRILVLMKFHYLTE